MRKNEKIVRKRQMSNYEVAAKVLGWDSYHNTQGSLAGMITFRRGSPIGSLFSFDVRENHVVEDTMRFASDFDEDWYAEMLLQMRDAKKNSLSQIVQISKDTHNSILRLAEVFDRMQQNGIDLFEAYIHCVMSA